MQKSARNKCILENDAQAANVFFVSEDSVTIDENADIKGNILAKNDVMLKTGAVLKGKALSTDGTVTLNSNNLGGGWGTLKICKEIAPSTGGVDLSNRIFRFTVSSTLETFDVPAGGCSTLIELPAGLNVVTELNNGVFPNGQPWQGNFQLIRVDRLASNSPSTLGVVFRERI